MAFFRSIVAVLLLLSAVACSSTTGYVPKDLTRAQWEALDEKSQFEMCLIDKIAMMRHRVLQASEPNKLIQYYPKWSDSLQTCQDLYKGDAKQAELRREAVAATMADVLGEETASFLHTQRLFKEQNSATDWTDMWRSGAIIGVAGVQDVLKDSH